MSFSRIRSLLGKLLSVTLFCAFILGVACGECSSRPSRYAIPLPYGLSANDRARVLEIAQKRAAGMKSGIRLTLEDNGGLLLEAKTDEEIEQVKPTILADGRFEIQFRWFDPRISDFDWYDLIGILGRSVLCSEHRSEQGSSLRSVSTNGTDLVLGYEIMNHCGDQQYPSKNLAFVLDREPMGTAEFRDFKDKSPFQLAAGFHYGEFVVRGLANPKDVEVILSSGAYPVSLSERP
jgi:hypothetical protein